MDKAGDPVRSRINTPAVDRLGATGRPADELGGPMKDGRGGADLIRNVAAPLTDWSATNQLPPSASRRYQFQEVAKPVQSGS